MDKVFFLVFGVWLFVCCASAQGSQITVTFKDAELPDLDNREEMSSSPIADIGVLMRMTNKLRSDIRTSTGFGRHHSANSLHIRTRAHHDHAIGDRLDEPEPISEELSERVPSHKSKDCPKQKKKNCKNGKTGLSKCLETNHNKHRLTSIKREKFQAFNRKTQQQTLNSASAHVEDLTDEELNAALAELLKEEITWVVRGKDGSMHVSDASEIGKVVGLNDDLVLPFSYKQYEMKVTKGVLDSLVDDGPNPAPLSTPADLFFSKQFGKVVVPPEKLNKEPFSSVGILKQNGFYCTGTFIGPRHVLTSAHCIFENQQWWGDLDFTLGNLNGARYEWDKAIVPMQWIKTGYLASNYGMIVVKSDMPQHTTMNFGWHDPKVMYGNIVQAFLIGYKLTRLSVHDTRLAMWRDFCGMKSEQISVFIEHDCHMSDVEDSGSPLFFPFSSDPIITCINSNRKSPDGGTGYCVHISKQIFSSLLYWIDSY